MANARNHRGYRAGAVRDGRILSTAEIDGIQGADCEYKD
jgi:hypothetical protein